MTAHEAFDSLKPDAWAATTTPERLALIKQIQSNLKKHAEELGAADAKMKNEQLGEEQVSLAEGMGGTVMPVANVLMAAHHIYDALAHAKAMPGALSQRQVSENQYEVEVYPQFGKDKIIAGKQKGYLRIEGGEPVQVSPLEKPAGVVAVSGAGNYSSSVEMVKALFFDNKAVIHKPHRLNEATDQVWAKIFAPLIERGALAFVSADQSRELTQLEGLTAIYFTGSTEVAQKIMEATDTPVVSECGGNNPAIIVPGDREWTEKEVRNQAINIVSAGKLNGGAVCGRPQTIVTCRNWPQRRTFLDTLKQVIAEDTFAFGSYYPNVGETRAAFLEAHPEAEVLTPEADKHAKSDFLFIEDMPEDSFGVKHEAFCQVFDEVALDVDPSADEFLGAATTFCNEKLLGTLGCMVSIDEDTKAAHGDALETALSELRYGGIAVNTIPPNIWLNAYLIWGGYGETAENFVSGIGNFGNALNFENVTKAILVDDFSAQAFAFINREATQHLFRNVANFAIDQSWSSFLKLAGTAAVDGMKKKDF